MNKILKFLISTDWLKTIRINMHYFPLRDAIKLPILIGKRTVINKMKGEIIFECPLRTGLLKIGYKYMGMQDNSYERTILEVDGTIQIKGNVSFGKACKISVLSGGLLSIDEDFLCTGASTIICNHLIEIGKHVLMSWDVLMMDTDFHNINSFNGVKLNIDKPIQIEDNVWISCRSTILKGTRMPHDSVLAANSLISKCCKEPNSLYGHLGVILNREIQWSR